MLLGAFPLEKNSGNCGWNSLGISVWERFVPFHVANPGAAYVTWRHTKMAAGLVVILDQVLAIEEEEMITASDDEEEIYLMVAILTFTKRKLNRNRVFFCKVVIPSHSLNVLKSHFRVTRATLEKFCREVEDTGRIPQGNRFGRPPVPCEGDRLKSMEWLSKEWKGAKSVSAECTDYCGQPKWRWAFEYIFSNTRYLPSPRERHSWFESDFMESALKKQIVHWSTEIEATFSQNDRGKFLSVDLELAWNTSNVVMEHENPFGAFQPEKWGYLFRRSTFTGNFPGKGTNQRIVFHLAPNRNFRTFFLNG